MESEWLENSARRASFQRMLDEKVNKMTLEQQRALIEKVDLTTIALAAAKLLTEEEQRQIVEGHPYVASSPTTTSRIAPLNDHKL